MFDRRCAPMLLAAILAAACHAQSPSTSMVPSRNANAVEGQAVACPSKDFSTFLKAFANDVSLQKSFTADPYRAVVVNDASMEQGEIVSYLTHAQVRFPVMLGDAQLHQHGASMETVRKADDWYEVLTHSEGSGAYSIVFNFHFRNDCWLLTDSLDTST